MANWLRSLLGLLGVVIGVATVLVMISIGEGTKRQIVESIKAMGSNLIVVENDNSADASRKATPALRVEDVELLRTHCHLAKSVAPVQVMTAWISYGGKSCLISVQGTTPTFAAINNLCVAEGRFLIEKDVVSSAKVCVLGARVNEKLEVKENLAGKLVRLNGQAFLVVGIIGKKGQTWGLDPRFTVFIPSTVCGEMSGDYFTLSSILIQGASSGLVQETKAEVKRLLAKSHNRKDDFSLWSQEELLQKQKRIATNLRRSFGALALITLLVAGIGVMNALLASFNERIREIGIRKAVGANPFDLFFQFLSESVLLTVTGGILGVISGMMASNWICRLLTVHFPQPEHHWFAIVSFESIVAAFAFAIITGVTFGLYPALKAARLDPCEAMIRD